MDVLGLAAERGKPGSEAEKKNGDKEPAAPPQRVRTWPEALGPAPARPPAGRGVCARGADDALSHGLPHDINNLLGLIQGHAEMALDGLHHDAPQRQCLERIATAAGLGAQLTARWLRCGKHRPERLFPADLNKLVAETLDLFRPLLPPSVKVVTDLDANLGLVAIDAVRIQEVVVNLLDNARDAMAGRGTLTIRTRNITLGKETLPRAPAGRWGRWVCLTVADDGVGMDAATLGRAGQPYFTSKEQGTGLGLAITRRIVADHDGWMTASAEPGRGATFSVYLPACSPAIEELFCA